MVAPNYRLQDEPAVRVRTQISVILGESVFCPPVALPLKCAFAKHDPAV